MHHIVEVCQSVLVKTERHASQGEPRCWIARTCLIIRKTAHGIAATAEKPFRKRHVVKCTHARSHSERMNPAEFRIAGQDKIARYPLVIGVAAQETQEILIAAERAFCKP